MSPRVASIVLPVLLSACAAAPGPGPDGGGDEWPAEQQAWCARREAALTAPDSYLALVALLDLPEGRSSLGAGAGADLRLPAGRAPDRVGTIERRGDAVRLVLAPGVEARIDGAPAPGASTLVSDAAGEPTRVTVGALTFWVVDRSGWLALRVRDPESPTLAAYHGTERYPPDPTWRVPARFEAFDAPREVDIPNVLGSTYADTAPGLLVFEHDGQRCELLPTGDEREGLFVVFGDSTNGVTTYGGGRFLALPPPAADGSLLIDFNRAYNPPCAYDEFTTCPLPPPGNRLPFAVRAGEKVAGLHGDPAGS